MQLTSGTLKLVTENVQELLHETVWSVFRGK